MPDVLVLGAGLTGLTAAMLLARDGHRVTVLERDPAEPPDPGLAWEEWNRRGCNQFRLPHFVQPAWRRVMEAELPDVLGAVVAAGAARFDPVAALPAAASGGRREDDDRFTAITARRPVLEAAVARTAAAEPGVTVRRGVTVRGLLTGGARADGVPVVTGVVTAGSGPIGADLVVDAGGRRSSLPDLLSTVGVTLPADEREDSGFVYYGRHFRGRDGLPPVRGSLNQQYDSVSVLTLPADNGTWSVTFAAAARDVELRALRETACWEAAMRCYPLAAHWIDAEPITGVAVMAGLEDRFRRLVVDGQPVVAGVVVVGDAWACTNPTVGRGVSMGLLHAVLLRDVLRTTDPGRPVDLAVAFDDATRQGVEPWYRATLVGDRHRLAEIEADRHGVRYSPDDPRWSAAKAMGVIAGRDPEVLRGVLDIAGMLVLPAEVMRRPGMAERLGAAAGAPQYVLPGPGRRDLLAAVGRAAALTV